MEPGGTEEFSEVLYLGGDVFFPGVHRVEFAGSYMGKELGDTSESVAAEAGIDGKHDVCDCGC